MGLAPRILRLPQVLELTGISRSTIYVRMGEGLFPKPVRLGPRAVGWIAGEIEAWIEARIYETRGSGRGKTNA